MAWATWLKVPLAGETVVFTRSCRGWNGQGTAFPREWAVPAAKKIKALLDLGISRAEAEAFTLTWLQQRRRAALQRGVRP